MIRWILGGSAGAVGLLGLATGAAGIDLQMTPAGPAAPSLALVPPLAHFRVTQGFGCTAFLFEPVDPACPWRHWHSGVDLAAPAGAPVHATAAGTATVIAGTTGYGLHIVVNHGGGLSSLYGHLSAVAVRSGELIDRGAVIGAVGSTGNSTGPHLHFEIRRNGTPEDPATQVQLS